MFKKYFGFKLFALTTFILVATLLSTGAICIAADGVLQVTVEKSPQNPIVGIRVYLFNESGAYLGQNQTTGSEGKVAFNLSEGNYKVRADYLGYQFWSPIYTVNGDLTETLTIAHQNVTVSVETYYQSTEPLAGVPVYLFTESGAYMSRNQTTDASGQVVFNLPEQAYKVRADYLSQQYWSNAFIWQDTAVTVPTADAEITVTGAGQPLENVKVYVFTVSGTYLSINGATDADGKVTFRLPAGNYKFRADYQGSQYWSDPETLTAGQVNPIGISSGGGILAFTVLKGASDPLIAANCYVFSESGTYLNMHDTTDVNGLVAFNLANGSYKVRVDYIGYQFWSPVYAVSSSLSETLTIAHQNVTVSVETYYQSTEPLAGVPVYLFTESGAYMSRNQTTDASGQVVFNLPEQAYKIRSDYLSQQYWSDVFTWQDTAVTVPTADAEITVTGASQPLEDVNVYVFTASGTYLSRHDATAAGGKVTFRLPAGDYKFRADYQGSQYWSDPETLTAGQVNPIGISTGGGILAFTVLKGASDPLIAANCYVFSESGTYLNMHETTDVNGLVSFNLANGSYKVRVDYLGYQFWSPVYAVSSSLSETLTIAHQNVTVSVETYYQSTEPLAGVPVYLFTESGAYMSRNQTTDASGQVVFNLPEQSYKVRADYLSQQHWSDAFIWQDTTMTINRGMAQMHVTRSGADVAGARVYLFSEAGAYLGWFETTDAGGKAEFLLPDSVYKFRADEGGDQEWSPVISITAGTITNVDIDLASIGVSINADPETIHFGESTTLTWNSINAASASIDNGIGSVDVNGSMAVSPTESTIYTITVEGPGGTAADAAEVVVMALPVDLDYGIHIDEQQGGGGLVGETIRVLNGNTVEFRSDLGFPSPHSLGLSYTATYNSRSDYSNNLGYGWTHTYSVVLDPGYEIAGRTYFKIVDQTGRAVYFTEETPGIYKGAFNERSQVKAEGGEYVWYRLNGSRYGFATSGELLWIDDEKGNRLTLAYDAQDRLETVADTAGSRVLTFNYNGNDLLESISGPVTTADSDGIWVTYGYDAGQNLTSVTYADGSGYTYDYTDPNDAHNLTEKKNKAGHLLNTWTYDDQDRTVGNFSRDGKGVTISYESEFQVNVTDAYGKLREYLLNDVAGRKRVSSIIDGPGGAGGFPYSNSSAVSWLYDESMRPTVIESAGGTVSMYLLYDERGNPGTVMFAYNTPEQREISYTYHPDMNAVLTRTEAGVLGGGDKEIVWDYDDDYDTFPNESPTGLLSRVVEKGFTKDISGAIVPYEYITTLTYNIKGQVLSIDGPLPGSGDTTFFTYDPTTGDLLSITRPLIGSTGLSNYDAAGQVGLVTDVNSRSKSFTYDGRGRVTAVTNQADGSNAGISYNTAGLVDSRTDEDGVTKSFEYDPVYGRLAELTDHEGNYILFSYDAQGNVIEKGYYDPTAVRSNWKRFSYQDPAHSLPGKLYKQINADDTFTQYGYDLEGNVASIIDPNSHTTTYDYDPFNRIKTVTQPGSVITAYGYDAHGNLASVTNAQSHVTTYEYDDMGRVVTTTSPDTGTVSYVYDEAGNLDAKTDAKGIAVGYAYDLLSRLTNVGFPDPTQNITYTYDTGADGMGRRTGMTDPSGSTAFGYDNRSRLVEKTSTVNGYNYSLTQFFTPGNRLTSVVYPTVRSIDYDRSANCPCSVDSVSTTYNGNTVTLMSNFSYRPFGIAGGMDTGSGGTVSNIFDEAGRLTVANPGAPKERTYTYDDIGNLTGVSAPNTPWYNRTFGYDALNRLEHAVGPFGNIDYSYDGVGNRLTKTVNSDIETYTYFTGTNRIQEITGPVAYTYDANGNITGIGDKVLVYNQSNRLVRVEENSDILGEYTYNGMGQRVIKEVGGVSTVFHYDFNGNIIAESYLDGNFNTEYLYNGKGRVALVDVSTEEMFFFLNDRLGTPQMLTDSTNTVAWEGLYKPFGEADVNPNSSVVNNFRFPGQYYDQEAGLHYNYHRYYDPATGRYLTPDPIGLLGGINLWTYAENNSINNTDPLGLSSFSFLDFVSAVNASISANGPYALTGTIIGGTAGTIVAGFPGGVVGGIVGGTYFTIFDDVSAGKLNYGEDYLLEKKINKLYWNERIYGNINDPEDTVNGIPRSEIIKARLIYEELKRESQQCQK